MRPISPDRRWKKALRLLQASAFFSDRQTITPVNLILLKECLWHDPAGYPLVNQQVELVILEQDYQQQAMLLKIQKFNRKKRQHISQSHAQRALTLPISKGMMSRKSYYNLPETLNEPVLTLVLHDINVNHITVEREAFQHWFNKGGELKRHRLRPGDQCASQRPTSA